MEVKLSSVGRIDPIEEITFNPCHTCPAPVFHPLR
jgi:hypothetical protein